MRGNMVKTKENGQIKKLNKKPVNLRLRPWLIILPTLVVTLGILYPFYQAVFYSLTDYSLKKPVWHFVGLKNWLEMFKGVNFWHSLWVTVKYTIAALVVEMGLGLVIALSLNRKDNISTYGIPGHCYTAFQIDDQFIRGGGGEISKFFRSVWVSMDR